MVAFRLIFTLLILISFSHAQQFAQNGCRNAGGTGYEIEFILDPRGENIKAIYGGQTENGFCTIQADPVDGLFKLTVPVDSGNPMQTNCGVIEEVADSRDFVLTVTSRSLDFGYKANDRRYRVICHFNGPTEIQLQSPQMLSLAGELQDLPVANVEYISSALRLTLVSATSGEVVNSVRFMDSVQLRVLIEENYHNAQSMMIKNCKATAMASLQIFPPDSSVQISGENGCPDGNTSLTTAGQPLFSGNMTGMFSQPFQMFMVPGADSIIFQCIAVLCPDDACVQTCSSRKRRQAQEISDFGEVLAIVRITGRGNSTDDALVTFPRKDESCANWPYLVAIACLSVVLVVTLGFAILLFLNRSQMSRVSDANAKPMA